MYSEKLLSLGELLEELHSILQDPACTREEDLEEIALLVHCQRKLYKADHDKRVQLGELDQECPNCLTPINS